MKQFNEVAAKTNTATVQFDLDANLIERLNQVAEVTGITQDALVTLGLQTTLAEQISNLETLGYGVDRAANGLFFKS
jgi:predicted transcriptional regulator